MRPLFVVLGLAFVATVLIANADAIKCYRANGDGARVEIDCDGGTFPYGAVSNGQCYKYEGALGKEWGCAYVANGQDICDGTKNLGFKCCCGDLCNGDVSPNETVTPASSDCRVTTPPPPTDSLKCYLQSPGEPSQKVDCNKQAVKARLPVGAYKECLTIRASNSQTGRQATARLCAVGNECDDFKRKNPQATVCCTRCSKDYCNDAPADCNFPFKSDDGPPDSATTSTSTAPVPLLNAIVASAIVALGF